MAKRIMDMKKIDNKTVEVEFFGMDYKKPKSFNQTGYATRKVQFPSKNSYDGAYINWEGEKTIVESLFL